MGTATPDSVRRALGHRYPYLEDAFDKIYSDPMYSHVRTQPASLQPADAINISGSFIQEIQGPPPLPNEEREWVTLEDRSIWEHAEWLDGELVERALGDDLDDSWVETSPDTPSEELAKKILRRNGSFVALVDEERVFQSLVDRYALLERVAKDLTETNIAG